MEGRAFAAAKAEKKRKTSLLVLSEILMDKKETGRKLPTSPAMQNHRINTPLNSLERNAQNSKTNDRLSTKDDENHRKYSENSYFEKNSTSNRLLGSTKFSIDSRRTKSLEHTDRSDIIIDQDFLLHGGYDDGALQKSPTPLVKRSSVDDMEWSTYWHQARDLADESSRNTDTPTYSHKQSSTLLDLKEKFNESIGKKAEDSSDDVIQSPKELTLRERLEKIEKEKGLVPKMHRRESGKISF